MSKMIKYIQVVNDFVNRLYIYILVDMGVNHQNQSHHLCSHIIYYKHITRPIIQVLLTWYSSSCFLESFNTIRSIRMVIYIYMSMHALASPHSQTLSHIHFFLKTTSKNNRSIAILFGSKKK